MSAGTTATLALVFAVACADGAPSPESGAVAREWAVPGNSGDVVELVVDGAVIDRVAWGAGNGWPSAAATTGASLSLRPASTTAAANDLGASWCAAATVYGARVGGRQDKGTPGVANVCP